MASAGEVLYLPGDIVTFEAGEDLSAGNVVYVSAAATESDHLVKVKKITAPSDAAIGVVLAAVSNGDPAKVLMSAPVVAVVADAAITVGNYVTGPGTTPGRVDDFDEGSPGVAATEVQYVIGVALQTTSDAGDVIYIALIQWGNVNTGT